MRCWCRIRDDDVDSPITSHHHMNAGFLGEIATRQAPHPLLYLTQESSLCAKAVSEPRGHTKALWLLRRNWKGIINRIALPLPPARVENRPRTELDLNHLHDNPIRRHSDERIIRSINVFNRPRGELQAGSRGRRSGGRIAGNWQQGGTWG